ncbi:MAG: DUF1566 domain-containing protein [Bacteroidales bacterium]|nr:DUF1566 domain-containing protein [Bacteroidales bacterium]
MKISEWSHRILLLLPIVLLSCDNKNEEVFNGIFSKTGSLATILTTPATSVTDTSAEAGGNLTDNGSTYIIARGICWGTDQNPDTSDFTIETGKEPGEFVCSITGLSKGTLYYMRAYVSNNIGTAYGNQETFTTLNIPAITTSPISDISDTTAVSGGNITADGGVNVTARGVCWSTKQNPTITDTISKDGSGKGIFTSSLKRLVPNTTYYVKAWATNSIGTAYGNELTFTTTSPTLLLPTLTTTAISAITQTTAVSGGIITSDGGAKVTARGVCWGTSSNPVVTGYHLNGDTISGNPSSFSNLISGLTANTTYYVRAFATNSIGTAYGNEFSFTTSVAVTVIPSISTNAISSVTQITATCGGNISNDGGANVTTRGVCWSTSPNPTISLTTKTSDGTGTGTFSSSITGLAPGTLYYVKAYASNSAGTAYGNEISFTTLPATGGTVTDIDGNVYNTIVIGTQTWLKENLKTTKYNDGSSIPIVADNIVWSTLTSGSYCWYDNAPTFSTSPYGALYNWYTIDATNNGNKNICPTGWHVPTDGEFTALESYLGGVTIAGGRLKEVGNLHWLAPNTGATNETGFTSLPAGGRNEDGSFSSMGVQNYLWSSTENGTTFAWARQILNNSTNSIRIYFLKQSGYSVRCILGTIQVLPSISTASVMSITSTSAICGGNITSDGGANVTTRGVCWSTSANPTISDSKTTDGSGIGTFSSSIGGLSYATTYHVRAYATNSIGTSYGQDLTFTTLSPLPVVTTSTVTSITSVSAVSGGDASSPYGPLITERGVCWNTSPNPTTANNKTIDGSGSGTFTSTITGLTVYTTYYVRAYATNGSGTTYGNERSFITAPIGTTVTDIDGNVYNTVVIGTQTWMKENLKTTKYRDGSSIPIVTDDPMWISSEKDAYCWFNNDPATYKEAYGGLYNYFAIIDFRYLCPTGWHVPTNSEWTTLTQYLGGESVAGGKLKSITGWNSPNTGATNESGFTALAGGYRYHNGPFSGHGEFTIFWSSTEYDLTNSFDKILYYNESNFMTGGWNPKQSGFSVRCLQGEPLTPAIGDNYQGGKIAYIFQPGDNGYIAGQIHGLIAAPSDQSTSAEWGCSGMAISGADGTAIGTGNQNTIDIVNGCTTTGTAAKLCSDLILNGYSDWYLPSIDDLNKLNINRIAIGGFAVGYYWSSTEISDIAGWPLAFNTVSMSPNSKSSLYFVRAVRTF